MCKTNLTQPNITLPNVKKYRSIPNLIKFNNPVGHIIWQWLVCGVPNRAVTAVRCAKSCRHSGAVCQIVPSQRCGVPNRAVTATSRLVNTVSELMIRHAVSAILTCASGTPPATVANSLSPKMRLLVEDAVASCCGDISGHFRLIVNEL